MTALDWVSERSSSCATALFFLPLSFFGLHSSIKAKCVNKSFVCLRRLMTAQFNGLQRVSFFFFLRAQKTTSKNANSHSLAHTVEKWTLRNCNSRSPEWDCFFNEIPQHQNMTFLEIRRWGREKIDQEKQQQENIEKCYLFEIVAAETAKKKEEKSLVPGKET